MKYYKETYLLNSTVCPKIINDFCYILYLPKGHSATFLGLGRELIILAI